MTAQSSFIAEVQEAFRKRGKAIRHRLRDLAIERVIERNDGDEQEKLEIACPLGHGKAIGLKLDVWDDRWVRIDVRRASKAGWVWEFTAEGRLPGSDAARKLVLLFEGSLSAGHGDERAAVELEKIWDSALATGPRAVP